jgi:secreted PhoX family phosphatase
MKAYDHGYTAGKYGLQKANFYHRQDKIQEYDEGYNEGLKMYKNKSFKNKPIMFHNGTPKHNKKRITLSIKGGIIVDIVRENIDCEVVVHDYDLEGLDVETNIHVKQDENGEHYQQINLE